MENKVSNIKNVSNFLQTDGIKKRFAEVLGKNSAAYLSSVLTILSQNDMLSNATPESVYTAALNAATLNLPLGLGQAYIVPFNNRKKGVVEAQFQLGYKGLIQLAIRSGQFSKLHSKPVYEGQLVSDDSFIGFEFDWSAKTSDKIIGFASWFRLHNGFESVYYMTSEDCRKHAGKFSQTYKNTKTRAYSLWETDFEKMALKTVTKLHLNSGEAPLSVDMQRAIVTDQSVINDVDTIDVDYVDNQTLSIEETQLEQEKQNVRDFIDGCDDITELVQVEEIAEKLGLSEEYQAKAKTL